MASLAPPPPDFVSTSESDVAAYAERRIRFVDERLADPSVQPGTKALYQNARAGFMALIDEMGSSWVTTWGGLDVEEQSLAANAERAFQEAEYAWYHKLPPSERPSVLTPKLVPIPWWLWAGGAALAAIYIMRKTGVAKTSILRRAVYGYGKTGL